MDLSDLKWGCHVSENSERVYIYIYICVCAGARMAVFVFIANIVIKQRSWGILGFDAKPMNLVAPFFRQPDDHVGLKSFTTAFWPSYTTSNSRRSRWPQS